MNIHHRYGGYMPLDKGSIKNSPLTYCCSGTAYIGSNPDDIIHLSKPEMLGANLEDEDVANDIYHDVAMGRITPSANTLTVKLSITDSVKDKAKKECEERVNDFLREWYILAHPGNDKFKILRDYYLHCETLTSQEKEEIVKKVLNPLGYSFERREDSLDFIIYAGPNPNRPIQVEELVAVEKAESQTTFEKLIVLLKEVFSWK